MKTILIVDDNMVSLKQASAQLKGKYEVSLAKTGEMALKICSKEKPDLILLDLEMPGMDGFQTINRLKSDPALSQIPVIFLTGNGSPATEAKCLDSGAMDFITKPVNTDILHHRIDIHLEYSAYQLNLENTVKELEDNIGISFAELAGCKDSSITGHAIRCGILAEMLTTQLYEAGTFRDALTKEDAEMMRRAAPFHDIGKIGISDILLLKRGTLTEEEHKEIQRHTLIGSQMLKQIYSRAPNESYLKLAMIIAEGHHERFDGKGYPRGLKGKEIPLHCRIMSVINVYDACVTDRVYRKNYNHKEACQIIIDGKGTLFDPQIVDVFDLNNDKYKAVQKDKKNHGWSILQ